MVHVYVLRSLKTGKRYIGFTQKDPILRLREHNRGSTYSTRHKGPYELIHREMFLNKTEAIKREKFLKSGQGRKWLDESVDIQKPIPL